MPDDTPEDAAAKFWESQQVILARHQKAGMMHTVAFPSGTLPENPDLVRKSLKIVNPDWVNCHIDIVQEPNGNKVVLVGFETLADAELGATTFGQVPDESESKKDSSPSPASDSKNLAPGVNPARQHLLRESYSDRKSRKQNGGISRDKNKKRKPPERNRGRKRSVSRSRRARKSSWRRSLSSSPRRKPTRKQSRRSRSPKRASRKKRVSISPVAKRRSPSTRRRRVSPSPVKKKSSSNGGFLGRARATKKKSRVDSVSSSPPPKKRRKSSKRKSSPEILINISDDLIDKMNREDRKRAERGEEASGKYRERKERERRRRSPEAMLPQWDGKNPPATEILWHKLVDQKSRGQALTKTLMCKKWKMRQCPVAASECRFAHGLDDQRGPEENLCYDFGNSGRCPAGDNCPFAHVHISRILKDMGFKPSSRPYCPPCDDTESRSNETRLGYEASSNKRYDDRDRDDLPVCIHWGSGNCKYGDTCKFKHIGRPKSGGGYDGGSPKSIPPSTYTCHACGVKGHWIQDCRVQRAPGQPKVYNTLDPIVPAKKEPKQLVDDDTRKKRAAKFAVPS